MVPARLPVNSRLLGLRFEESKVLGRSLTAQRSALPALVLSNWSVNHEDQLHIMFQTLRMNDIGKGTC